MLNFIARIAKILVKNLIFFVLRKNIETYYDLKKKKMYYEVAMLW